MQIFSPILYENNALLLRLCQTLALRLTWRWWWRCGGRQDGVGTAAATHHWAKQSLPLCPPLLDLFSESLSVTFHPLDISPRLVPHRLQKPRQTDSNTGAVHTRTPDVNKLIYGYREMWHVYNTDAVMKLGESAVYVKHSHLGCFSVSNFQYSIDWIVSLIVSIYQLIVYFSPTLVFTLSKILMTFRLPWYHSHV